MRDTRPAWDRATRVVEIVVFGVAGVAVAVGLVVPFTDGESVVAVLAGVLSTIGLVTLGRWPAVALTAAALAPIVAAAGGEQPTGAWSIAVFVAFLLALRHLPGLLVGAVMGAANLIAVAAYEGGVSFEQPAASIAAVCALAGASLGSGLRAQRRFADELEGRARDAIETRRADVERSVAEERLRIARDLHDSIGHEIAVVSMHLGTAEVLLPTDALEVRASLDAAREAVRAVLDETQQVLRVLRVGDADDTLAPTPGHAQIARLVQSTRGAGLPIDATVSGLDRPLPLDVSLAAYRIVQEVLTNAHRHSTGTLTLKVEVGERVLIESVNVRASQSVAPVGGHGLTGMRERAESVDGTVDWWVENSLFWMRVELPAGTDQDERTA